MAGELQTAGTGLADDGSGFKITRRRYTVVTALGRRYATFVKIELSPAMTRAIKAGRLRSCEIQTSSPGLLNRAFQFQLNRVRDRWNVPIQRSSGFVLVDMIWRGWLGLVGALRALIARIFGTRTRFSDLLTGAEFQHRTLEEQKDCETMVFASIAAVLRAARFADDPEANTIFHGEAFMREVPGLTFSGGMVGTMGDDEGDADDDDDDSEVSQEDETDAQDEAEEMA